MRIVNKFIHEYSMSTVSYIYIIYVYVKCEKNSMILIVWNIFLYCTLYGYHTYDTVYSIMIMIYRIYDTSYHTLVP